MHIHTIGVKGCLLLCVDCILCLNLNTLSRHVYSCVYIDEMKVVAVAAYSLKALAGWVLYWCTRRACSSLFAYATLAKLLLVV